MSTKYNLLLAFLGVLIAPSIATSNRTLAQFSYRLSGRSIAFPSDASRMIYKDLGRYIPRNIVATRMQFWRHKFIFSLPRYKSGVPLTLGSVNMQIKDTRLNLEPFPSWSLQQEGNCDAMQSAVDLYLDHNQVLWVLDAGVTRTLETPQTKCPPKIVAISMLTHRVTKTIDLSPFVNESSNLQYIVAENTETGDDYVYVADAGSKALIAFNANIGRGRRLLLPEAVSSGCENNALYLALLRRGNTNYLYFKYLDCNSIYSVATPTLASDQSQSSIQLVGRPSESIVFLGTNGHSKLYFRRKQQSDVFVWDSNTPFPTQGWQMVWRGDEDRMATHVTLGPLVMPWVLETNIMQFIENSTGSLGASTKLSPITRVIN